MNRIYDGARGRDTLDVGRVVGDSFHRSTHWRLEKRVGDVYGFMQDRRVDAQALAAGRRARDLPADRFMANLYGVQGWLNDQKTPMSISELWTPAREIDAALHKLFHDEVDAEEVVEADGNLLVTVGITALLNLLKGDAETAFSNANSHLGVGDSATAAAVGQTDLQAATNKLRKAMNATYPIDTSPTIDFQSTFGSSEANFVWAEVGTFSAATAGDMLNRVVQALGTKSSGATWTLTETITWS